MGKLTYFTVCCIVPTAAVLELAKVVVVEMAAMAGMIVAHFDVVAYTLVLHEQLVLWETKSDQQVFYAAFINCLTSCSIEK